MFVTFPNNLGVTTTTVLSKSTISSILTHIKWCHADVCICSNYGYFSQIRTRVQSYFFHFPTKWRHSKYHVQNVWCKNWSGCQKGTWEDYYSFLASQDAIEVMSVTDSVTDWSFVLIWLMWLWWVMIPIEDFTDVIIMTLMTLMKVI